MSNVSAITKTVILNSADTLKLIGQVGRASELLQGAMHQAAMSAMANYAKSGNTGLINALLLALPKSQRRQAVAAWALRFAPSLALNDDKSTKKAQPLVHVKGAMQFQHEAADAMPFWNLKAKEGADEFNADAFMASLVVRLNSAIQKGGTPEQMQKLRAAVEALK